MNWLWIVVSLSLPALGQEPAAPPSAETAAPAAETPASPAKPVAAFPAGYPDHATLSASIKELAAAHPERFQVETLARTASGREVWMVRIGPAATVEEPRPAILLVGNVEADHVVGSLVALRMLEKIASADEETATRLDRVTLYVIPRLNVDGAERLLSGVRTPLRTNLRPIDRDRDGARGEDGPDDLDGDGDITTMRVPDTAANLRPDSDDPRILVKVEPGTAEPGLVSEYLEGRDDDADGALNEDPAGGVRLDRNFTWKWPEYEIQSGPTPLSEPETRALAEFVFEHPELVAIWSFGLADNLKTAPKKPDTTLDDADLPLLVELSKQYGKALESIPKGLDQPTPAEPTSEKNEKSATVELTKDRTPVLAPRDALTAPDSDGTKPGNIAGWAYHHAGLLGLTTRLWDGPDFPETAEGQPAAPKEGEARWLFWNDRVLGGTGFAPLRPYNHPTLGPVMVGGWKPGTRINPPADRIAPIVEAQSTFLATLIDRLPTLRIAAVQTRALGAGVYQIEAVVENSGGLPTALAEGVKVEQAPPVLVRLNSSDGRILAGKPLERINRLTGAGGNRRFVWLIEAPETLKTVTVEARCPKAGRAVHSIELPR